MSKTNSKLASIIGSKKPKPQLVAAKSIPTPNTKNIQGLPAYSQDKWLTLLTMLNTLKLEPQYYRTPSNTLRDLQKLIDECSKEDLYLTCQCIVYSRCIGEGMRSISHAASVFIAPHISGQEYSKRFYGLWNKKEQKGGVIFRPDDMSEILQGYIALNGHVKTTTVTTKNSSTSSSFIKGPKLSNAMKKGFKSVLESLDNYSLLKYKSSMVDLINLVHPNPRANPTQIVKTQLNGKEITTTTIDAIMNGYNVSANTWEVNQGNAGQIVAQAVKEGKLDEKEALIAATIAKATNADIMYFGTNATYLKYNPNEDVFTIAKKLAVADQGGTNLASAWQLAQQSGNKYNRVFILSDNEVNRGSTYSSYMSYVKNVGDPYIYSVDLAGYGTNSIAGDKVRYYYGYGFSMFDDIAKLEFNAQYHLDKVKKVVI